MSIASFVGPPNYESVVQAISAVQIDVRKLCLQMDEPDPVKAATRLSECFRRAWALSEKFRVKPGISRDTYFRAVDMALEALRNSGTYFSENEKENDTFLWTLVVASKLTDCEFMVWFTSSGVRAAQSDPTDSTSGVEYEAELLQTLRFDVMRPTLYQLAAAFIHKAKEVPEPDKLSLVLADVTFSPDLLVSVPRAELAAGAARLLALHPEKIDTACGIRRAGFDASAVAGRIFTALGEEARTKILMVRSAEELSTLEELGRTVHVEPAFVKYRRDSSLQRTNNFDAEYTKEEKQIGEGTYGNVFPAKKIADGKDVVVKIMKNESNKNGKCVYGIRQTSLCEIASLKLFSNASHIVEILDAFATPENVYVVFEACERDLHALLRKNRTGLLEPTVRRYSFQLLCAVDLLHSLGFIHRDLKPANILILKDTVKVADAGLIFQQDMFEDKILSKSVQTLNYRAPEILSSAVKNAHYSFPVDMWSVACILSEMATGQEAFPGENVGDVLGSIKATFPSLEDYLTRSTPSKKSLTIGLDAFTPEWKELLERMYVRDPDLRIRADEALELAFFRKAGLTPPAQKTVDEEICASTSRRAVKRKLSPQTHGSASSPARQKARPL